MLLTSCHTVRLLPEIPDAAYAKGVSAPFCGVLDGCLVVAGGANFPDKPLLEGGAKRVYDDIWMLCGEEWRRIAHLPDSAAYGACYQLQDGLLFAGGTGLDKVYLLDSQGLHALPALPCPLEQGAAAYGDGVLYLCAGRSVYTCREGEWAWSELAQLPMPLVQPLAYVSGGWLYLWGGFNPETLELPSKGWKMRLDAPGRWTDGPVIPDGGTFVGSAAAVLPGGCLAVAGGVNREVFARALHNGPEDRIPYLSREPEEYRFNRKLYIFNPFEETWTVLLEDSSLALAGPGLACDGRRLYVAGGEIKPGVRSPRIFSIDL